MTVKVGEAKFGSSYVKRQYWKLKDGESTYRILPPLGFNGKEPDRWSHFYNVHYGYKNTQGQMRVFQSPLVKNNKTRMIDVPDAALQRIEALQAKKKEAQEKKDSVTVERISALLQQYNLDNNHYVNAMDEQGNIGILKLRHRAKVALDTTIKSLRESGVEPLGADSGRFFVFRRSGNGLDTHFSVTIKQRDLMVEGVGKVKQDIVHTLTPEILDRLGREAAELDNLYKRPTAEEVKRIVETSDLMTGHSTAIDEIFNSKKDESNEVKAQSNSIPAARTDVTQPAATTPTASQPVSPNVVLNVMTSTGEPGSGGSSEAVVQAPVQVATVKVAATPAPTAAPSVSTMSDEDFLKSLGL